MSVYIGNRPVDFINTAYGSVEDKPYDSKIEYLEGDGLAYIDTEVIPSAETTVETYVQMSQTTSTSYPTICGSRGNYNSSGAPRYTIRFDQNITSSGVCGNTFQKSYSPTVSHEAGDGPFQIDALNKVKMCMNATGCYYTIVGSSSIRRTSFSITSLEPFTTSLYLYTVHYPDETISSDDAGKYVRIFSFYLKEKDTVLDLIPVRVGTVGYMYDKISGKLFGNKNTEGAFVLGPDIN